MAGGAPDDGKRASRWKFFEFRGPFREYWGGVRGGGVPGAMGLTPMFCETCLEIPARPPKSDSRYFVLAETSLRISARAAKSRSGALFLALGARKFEKRRCCRSIVKHMGFGLKPLLEFLLGALGPLLDTLF